MAHAEYVEQVGNVGVGIDGRASSPRPISHERLVVALETARHHIAEAPPVERRCVLFQLSLPRLCTTLEARDQDAFVAHGESCLPSS
jgi:hypothetical protein